MKWNPFYAADPKLNKVRPEPGTSVPVTCLDKRGARKVVQAHCSDDAAQPFSTKSPVIAWAPMPEPYSGAAAPAQGHLFREAKAAILNAVRTAPAGYVENGKLRRHVMQTVGCSEGTYLRASRELSRSGQIVKKQILLRPYTSGWITYLPRNRVPVPTQAVKAVKECPLDATPCSRDCLNTACPYHP